MSNFRAIAKSRVSVFIAGIFLGLLLSSGMQLAAFLINYRGMRDDFMRIGLQKMEELDRENEELDRRETEVNEEIRRLNREWENLKKELEKLNKILALYSKTSWSTFMT